MTITPAEAAKRLRAYRQRVANNEVDSDDFLKSVGECYPVLVEAYLEQNPADDEEAITREWVYENMAITGYGAKINNFLYLKQSRAGWGIYAFDANSDYVEEQFLVASITTRRDLRGLLRGLGGRGN